MFDISPAYQEYLSYEEKRAEASRLGLECVPCLHRGKLDLALFNELLDRESCLGGPKIEGVVIKPLNYDLSGIDKQVLMAKYVSEAFKEQHRTEWNGTNPSNAGFIEALIADYRTEARWNKTIQHVRDSGSLLGEPKDIGPLLKELSDDLDGEVSDEIKERLFKHFWKDIKRGAMRGFPEHYKTLLEGAFSLCPKK